MRKHTDSDLTLLLDGLRSNPQEASWFEFKSNSNEPERIGRYISGLANGACTANRDFAYMVWGISDSGHELIGTNFDPEKQKIGNQPLLLWLNGLLVPSTDFGFNVFFCEGKRIVLLEIEAAYRQPVAFRGTPWWRLGSSLVELSQHPDAAAMIYRTVGRDWSSEVVLGATVADLDSEALVFAREQYLQKHKGDSFSSEIQGWDTATFLAKARLSVGGKLTRAALLLLGRSESAHWLAPSVSRISWVLSDAAGEEVDYQHFDPPFLLAVNKIFAKIRNITIRALPDGTLFPVEMSQYDSWVFREALHNCIAHQDYGFCRTVVVREYPDRIVFANAGAFRPGTLEQALQCRDVPRYYPNRQLTDVMVELRMIDTIGSGIRRMFIAQKKRFMPLPDFIIEPDSVQVVLPGRVLDMRYSQLLLRQPDLTLEEIILLDRIQKGRMVAREVVAGLRKRGLIEGRYPKIYPAVGVAQKTRQLESYFDTRGYDDQFYVQMVLQYLCSKGKASRAEISNLLMKHLPAVLGLDEKKNKIGNLLSVTMGKRKKLICNQGGTGRSCWLLTESGKEACRVGNPGCKRVCRKASGL